MEAEVVQHRLALHLEFSHKTQLSHKELQTKAKLKLPKLPCLAVAQHHRHLAKDLELLHPLQEGLCLVIIAQLVVLAREVDSLGKRQRKINLSWDLGQTPSLKQGLVRL